MKVQKIVSLDVKTANIAQDLVNFSAFVRECLLAHQVGGSYAQMSRITSIWMRVADLLAREISQTTGEDVSNIVNHCLIEARAEIAESEF